MDNTQNEDKPNLTAQADDATAAPEQEKAAEVKQGCVNCHFWLYEGRTTPGGPIGLCRESPPHVFLIAAPPLRKNEQHQPPSFMSQFPPMLHDGWCGQWKLTNGPVLDVIGQMMQHAPAPEQSTGNVTSLHAHRPKN